MKSLLTYDQAAEVLGVSPRTVRRMVDRGQLPVVNLSARCHRIDPDDIDRMIQANKQVRENECRTAGKTAPTGTSRTPTQAARELESLLAQPIRMKTR